MSADRRGSNGEDLVVPGDDRIIAVVFRRSLAVVAVAAVVVVAASMLLRNRGEAQEVVVDRGAVVAPASLSATGSDSPDIPFTDITQDVGISWSRNNGAVGSKLLPETMGGGAAFFDGDGDGDADLLLIGGRPWSRDGDDWNSLALYRNDGETFTDITARSGLGTGLQGMGVAVGDVDNDGRPDVFVSALGHNHLFRNLGDWRFAEVTRVAGVAGAAQDWSTGAGFADVDGDGWLDLFVCNYVQWSRELDIDLHFTLNGTDRAYGPPNQYPGVDSVLYRNRGDGSFEDVTEAAGIRVRNRSTGLPKGKALAVTFLDVDSNGALDIFVANDTVDNFLFVNRGDGTFDEVGRSWGVATDSAGAATGAMGADAGFVVEEDRAAIAVGNFANEASSFFLETGGHGFSDFANLVGLGSESRLRLTFGLFFFDADLDGRLDLLQANGHFENEITEVQPSQTFRQPGQLFWNTGRRPRTFAALNDAAVGDLARPVVGRGATYADIDGDGDLDVLLMQPEGAPALLRNDQRLDHHWLRVLLVGGDGINRDAIGSRVELTAGGATQRQQVMPTRSYLSQVEPVLTFGLGEATTVDQLTVLWSDGRRQEIPVDGVDRKIVVTR